MVGTLATPEHVGKRLGLGFVPADTLTGTPSGTTVPLASTATGKYKAAMVVRLYDNDNPDGELRTIASVAEGVSLTLTVAVAGTYTVAQSGKVQIQAPFSKTSYPDWDTVDAAIEDAESTLESDLGGVSFVPRRIPDSGDTTYKHLYFDTRPTRHGYYLPGDNIDEFVLDLGYRDVVPFDSASDVLDIWNGTSWVSILTGLTIARNGAWWPDYPKGLIHFLTTRPVLGSGTVRASFRVGDLNVPPWARRAVIARAAIMVLQSDHYAQRSVDADGPGRIGGEAIMGQLEAEYQRIVEANQRAPVAVAYV